MTTEQLLGTVSGYKFIAGSQVQVTPDDVYSAGSIAQTNLCRDLELVEDEGQLALLPGQAAYSYSPLVITSITNVAPLTVGFNRSHGLGTGDSGWIAGVVGLVEANGRWPSVTKVDNAHISLDGSIAGALPWASGGAFYPTLLAVTHVRNEMGLFNPAGSYLHFIQKRTRNEFRRNLTTFADSSGNVQFFSQLDGPTLKLVFEGTPSTPQIVKFDFNRKPLPIERLSATVDPILPDDFDKLLFLATIYETISLYLFRETGAEKEMKIAIEELSLEKGRVQVFLSKRRFTARQDHASMGWGSH